MTSEATCDRDAETASDTRPLTPADLPAGTVVDKYRLGKVLGQGGMGLVVAAEHTQLRERVALKFLRVDGDQAQGFRSRFKREAQICAQIKNEHITRVLDIGTYKDTDYMVMECLSGEDLRQHLKRCSALSIAEAIDVAVQACSGLAEVHARGVVHRDLKPSNLFVTQRSDGSRLVKILDFGISKWASEMDAGEEELTKTGAVLGSPRYMAPEQLFGSNSVDARADVWSIGAILYELLTGKPPFEEPNFVRLCMRLSSGQPPPRPRERRPEISEELDAAVMLCLEPNLEKRLPNVAELAGELLAAIGDEAAEPTRERLLAALGVGPIAPLTHTRRSASMSLARTISTEVAAPAVPPKSNKIVLVIVAVAAVSVIFLLTRKSPDAPPVAATNADKPIVTPSVTTSAAPSADADSVATSVTATSAATSPPRPGVKVIKALATPKPAEPATTPVAAPPAAPAPTPVATKPKSANPLEDRQ